MLMCQLKEKYINIWNTTSLFRISKISLEIKTLVNTDLLINNYSKSIVVMNLGCSSGIRGVIYFLFTLIFLTLRAPLLAITDTKFVSNCLM